jgi:hypothetical protein
MGTAGVLSSGLLKFLVAACLLKVADNGICPGGVLPLDPDGGRQHWHTCRLIKTSATAQSELQKALQHASDTGGPVIRATAWLVNSTLFWHVLLVGRKGQSMGAEAARSSQ